MGATPTPWSSKRCPCGANDCNTLQDANGTKVAEAVSDDGIDLIVTAVNNHAALKDAITTAAEWFEEYAAEHNRKAQDAPPGFERDSREVKAKTNANRAKFLRLTLSAASASETGKEG